MGLLLAYYNFKQEHLGKSSQVCFLSSFLILLMFLLEEIVVIFANDLGLDGIFV